MGGAILSLAPYGLEGGDGLQDYRLSLMVALPIKQSVRTEFFDRNKDWTVLLGLHTFLLLVFYAVTSRKYTEGCSGQGIDQEDQQ